MDYLISRSSLIKMLETYKFGCLTNEVERDYIKETMIEFVKTEPTAYDVEKVVAEIEIDRQVDFNYHIRTDYRLLINDIYDKTVQKVRRGGVE